jgi:HEAT repeat protein
MTKVRDAAVLGLSKIGTPAASAESVLEGARKDKDLAVRIHAVTALKRVRGAK